jgi:hypothetical protein
MTSFGIVFYHSNLSTVGAQGGRTPVNTIVNKSVGLLFLDLLSALNEQKLVSRSSAAHFYEDFLFDARGLPVLFN